MRPDTDDEPVRLLPVKATEEDRVLTAADRGRERDVDALVGAQDRRQGGRPDHDGVRVREPGASDRDLRTRERVRRGEMGQPRLGELLVPRLLGDREDADLTVVAGRSVDTVRAGLGLGSVVATATAVAHLGVAPHPTGAAETAVAAVAAASRIAVVHQRRERVGGHQLVKCLGQHGKSDVAAVTAVATAAANPAATTVAAVPAVTRVVPAVAAEEPHPLP